MTKLRLNLQPNDLRIARKEQAERIRVANKYCSQGTDCTILGHGPLEVDDQGELTFNVRGRSEPLTIEQNEGSGHVPSNAGPRVKNKFPRIVAKGIHTVLSTSFPLACYLLLAL